MALVATATNPPKADALTTYQRCVYRDPVGWADECLGVRLWAKQRAVLEAVRDCDDVAVPSGHSTGKTWLTGVLAWWWVNATGGKVVITSASWENLRLQVWPKIHRVIAGAKAPIVGTGGRGRLNTMDWFLSDDTAIVSISPLHPEVGGGFHSANGLLVIVDEASRMKPDLEAALIGCLASGGKMVMIGNPLSNLGPFANAIRAADKPGATTRKVHISAYESPNITGAEPPIPGLATREWIEKAAEKYGKDSPLFNARVCGLVPESEAQQVIPIAWLQDAYDRPVNEDGARSLGCDIGRSTDGDPTVLQPVIGNHALPPRVERINDLTKIADLVEQVVGEHRIPWSRVQIDDIGVGSGVTDTLRRRGHTELNAVNVGMPAGDADTFGNVRAEAAWGMRCWIEKTGALARDEAMEGDLCAPRFLDRNGRGQLRLEPKEDTKERLGHSPDRFDALMLALYAPAPAVMERRIVMLPRQMFGGIGPELP